MNFQDMIRHLEEYWANMDCLILQPYNSEVGAGTFNPATFLRVLDNDDWKTAYLEISKRPKDGRYGQNPNRMQQFYQYQVVLQPAPDSIQDIYIESLEAIGIETKKHDIRFVEDDWESPTLGAKGLGWEVWLDGMEITQFTYFQQMASRKIENVPVELTYGLERIAMFIQQKNSVQELQWSDSMNWSEVMLESEKQFCIFNFDEADIQYIREQFEKNESEVKRLLEKELVYPAYDYLIKATHAFNLLDARGAVSPKERQGYIKRIRDL
ncbi:MAG: glycine--tRNA ligase subunit alpha, partial [candidate division WOR-3 bacterium]|nr:glycine--tRNA ligase subunit alpha [candidate division WOR-3 bacterium]